MTAPEVFIGVTEVRPRWKGVVAEDALGAFVNLLAKVTTEEDFRREATALLGSDFHIVGFEDVETLKTRMEQWELEEPLRTLARAVDVDGLARLGTFHTFSEKDDEE